MKIALLFIATVLLMNGCKQEAWNVHLANRTMQYQIEGNKYLVITVEDGISQAEARKEAVQKAAQTALDNGYAYFVIDSEMEVMMVKSKGEYPNYNARPQNNYYELIQSNNFGKEPLDQPNPEVLGTYKGWQIKFSCYTKKPSSKALEACDYTKCVK